MARGVLLVIATLAFALLSLAGAIVVRAYLRFRGTRVVKCPETDKPAAVEVDATHFALRTPLGEPGLRLKDCSHWPERQGCGKRCLKQIESAPDECLVRTIATRWYQGKSCCLCGKCFEGIHWSDHKPALMDSEGRTLQWYEIRPDKLPEVLVTHLPICWNCYVNETLRRRYPELSVERPSDLAQVRHKTS